ncbi:hypothetical protein GDO86_013695, partial [Hymenochirus boettgeri]
TNSSACFSYVKGESICYKNIGCFSDEAPFGGTLPRPLGYVPESPDEIDTKLLLFTTKNPDDFQVISPLTPSAVSVSNFKTGRKTYFIIHGFLDNGDDYWLTDMCKTILKVEDVNCFCVDWKKGALALYPQAANNIRVVGAQIAYFIGFLNSNFQYSPSNIHLIGHSLGAQTAGEAGKRIRGLGRITGLDPAGPYFLNTPQEVRLDSTDANFVDVIHTDTQSDLNSLGYGIVQLSGHLDFFPNGGKQMAGCNKSTVSTLLEVGGLWEGSRDVVGCNHFRSYKYYTESILTPEGFIGYPSPSYEAFKNGVGFPCPSTGCPLMGHYANRYSREKSSGQSFFLNTGAEKPFARWRYKVTITTTGTIHFMGSIRVSLLSLKSKTKEHEIVR